MRYFQHNNKPNSGLTARKASNCDKPDKNQRIYHPFLRVLVFVIMVMMTINDDVEGDEEGDDDDDGLLVSYFFFQICFFILFYCC